MSAKTTPEYLIENAEKYPNEAAISSKDENGNWDTTTWSEFKDDVVALSKALIANGFDAGDKLSIYSYNPKEWYSAYSAANMCNGAAVGGYHTCSPEEVEWSWATPTQRWSSLATTRWMGGKKERCAPIA